MGDVIKKRKTSFGKQSQKEMGGGQKYDKSQTPEKQNKNTIFVNMHIKVSFREGLPQAKYFQIRKISEFDQ